MRFTIDQWQRALDQAKSGAEYLTVEERNGHRRTLLEASKLVALAEAHSTQAPAATEALAPTPDEPPTVTVVSPKPSRRR